MATQTSEEHFTVTYDGPAVELGRMSVQELAASLVALSRSLREAQQLISPLTPEPALDIHAMREGSFAVDLIVYEASLVQQALDFFAGNREVQGALNLSGLVTVAFGGFSVVRKLSQRIRREEYAGNDLVRITFGNGTTLLVPESSMTLVRDRGFREAAHDVVQPLAADGVDELRLESTGRDSVIVTNDDLSSFAIPAAGEEELADGERTVALRLVSVAFVEGNKWRVSDGESVFWVSVLDQRFLDEVSAGKESFNRTDIMRARLRTRQWRDADGELRTEHSVIEVIEHVRGSRDVPLPLIDHDDGG